MASGKAMRRVEEAAAYIRRTGFVLLMPHAGMPLPTLWEAIRGRRGGHPFDPWTRHSDRLWAWKDELPARRAAYYGAIWNGLPGFCAPSKLPLLLRLRRAPPGADGFRVAYAEGRLGYDANRICETLLREGALNTYRLRLKTGLRPPTFKNGLRRLQRALIVAKCGAEDTDTTWPAEVVDLTARVFPRADAAARSLAPDEAAAAALATMREAAPGLADARAMRLLAAGG